MKKIIISLLSVALVFGFAGVANAEVNAVTPRSPENVMATTDELLTRQEAAELLTIQPQTLAVWAAARKNISFIKVGKSVRYRLSDLRAFLERQTVGCDTEA